MRVCVWIDDISSPDFGLPPGPSHFFEKCTTRFDYYLISTKVCECVCGSPPDRGLNMTEKMAHETPRLHETRTGLRRTPYIYSTHLHRTCTVLALIGAEIAAFSTRQAVPSTQIMFLNI